MSSSKSMALPRSPVPWWQIIAICFCYVPYNMAVSLVCMGWPDPDATAPLESVLGYFPLPIVVAGSVVATIAFLLRRGWLHDLKRMKFVGGWVLPLPDRWAAASALCVIVITTTTTVAFAQGIDKSLVAMLLMRTLSLWCGPVSDWIVRRPVDRRLFRPFLLATLAIPAGLALDACWVALDTGGNGSGGASQSEGVSDLLSLLLLAVLNAAAYLGRILCMEKAEARSDDQMARRRFIAGEQVIAFPLLMILITVLAASPQSWPEVTELRVGFEAFGSFLTALVLILAGLFSAGVGILSALVLVANTPSTLAVVLHRSSSVIGSAVAVLSVWVMNYLAHLELPIGSPRVGQLGAVAIVVYAIWLANSDTGVHEK